MYDFEEKRPFEIPIVVLDTETTGLQAGLGHRVIEFGAVRLEKGQIVGEMNTLIQPGRHIDPKASAVNGISDADLVNQPTFADIADELLGFIDGALLVAHNAVFDAEFLGLEFWLSHRVQGQGREPVLPNPWLCTLLLARSHFTFGQNNLGAIAQNLGVRRGTAHRALSDVYMTAEVLKRMVQELAKKRLQTVGDLLMAQGQPIYTPPVPQIHLLPVLAEALENGRSLQILYMGEYGQSQRIITPHYPTQYRGQTYLVAYCHLKREVRIFRQDRIFSAEILQTPPGENA